MKKNRRSLTSILKCQEFCGRQGLALRGHRDDSKAPDKRQQRNFKGLLNFCVDAGDQVLQEHIEMCSKMHHTSPKQHKGVSRMHQTVSSRPNHRFHMDASHSVFHNK